MMFALWLMALGVYGAASFRAVRAEDRAQAAAEAERQAERDRRLAVMRGADWAWQRTPAEWVKS